MRNPYSLPPPLNIEPNLSILVLGGPGISKEKLVNYLGSYKADNLALQLSVAEKVPEDTCEIFFDRVVLIFSMRDSGSLGYIRTLFNQLPLAYQLDKCLVIGDVGQNTNDYDLDPSKLTLIWPQLESLPWMLTSLNKIDVSFLDRLVSKLKSDFDIFGSKFLKEGYFLNQ